MVYYFKKNFFSFFCQGNNEIIFISIPIKSLAFLFSFEAADSKMETDQKMLIQSQKKGCASLTFLCRELRRGFDFQAVVYWGVSGYLQTMLSKTSHFRLQQDFIERPFEQFCFLGSGDPQE